MKIAANTVVSLEYSLHLGDGVIEEGTGPDGEPFVYLYGSGHIVPGLERQLDGLEVGDTRSVVVAPAEGYGERDPQAMRTVPISAFSGRPIQVGDELFAVDDDDNQMPVRVEQVDGDQVTVDLNHPLAGKTLHFSVTIKDVRPASEEEIAHRHAHGDGGHHHD